MADPTLSDVLKTEGGRSVISFIAESLILDLKRQGIDLKEIIRQFQTILQAITTIMGWFGLFKKSIEVEFEKKYPAQAKSIRAKAGDDFWDKPQFWEVAFGFFISLLESILGKSKEVPQDPNTPQAPQAPQTRPRLNLFGPDEMAIAAHVKRLLDSINKLAENVEKNSLSDERLTEIFNKPALDALAKVDELLKAIRAQKGEKDTEKALMNFSDNHDIVFRAEVLPKIKK